MDRRHRDYFVVTFDKCDHTEDFRKHFSITSQLMTYGKHIVKVRWYSINHQPYALISIPKRFTWGVLGGLIEVPGIHKFVEWNAHREKEFANQFGFIRDFSYESGRAEAVVELLRRCRKEHEKFAERIVTGDVDITW